ELVQNETRHENLGHHRVGSLAHRNSSSRRILIFPPSPVSKLVSPTSGQEVVMRNSRAEKLDWPAILAEAVEKPGVISKAYSTFWNYSFGNQLSALFQCMIRGIEPGPIHTYKGWQELGRQVKKGEKAIILTMPVTVSDKRRVAVKAGGDSAEPTESDRTPLKRMIFVERPHWFVLS